MLPDGYREWRFNFHKPVIESDDEKHKEYLLS